MGMGGELVAFKVPVKHQPPPPMLAQTDAGPTILPYHVPVTDWTRPGKQFGAAFNQQYIGQTQWRFVNASWAIEVPQNLEGQDCSGTNAVQIEIYCGNTVVEAEPLPGANFFKNVPGKNYTATREPKARHYTKCATHPFTVLMTNLNNLTGGNGCTMRWSPLTIFAEYEFF